MERSEWKSSTIAAGFGHSVRKYQLMHKDPRALALLGEHWQRRGK